MNIKGIEKEMQLKQLKIELIQMLLDSDELSLLQKLRDEFFNGIEVPGASKVVGYNASGEPITKKEMEQKLRESISQAEKGDTTNFEDLDQEAEKW